MATWRVGLHQTGRLPAGVLILLLITSGCQATGEGAGEETPEAGSPTLSASTAPSVGPTTRDPQPSASGAHPATPSPPPSTRGAAPAALEPSEPFGIGSVRLVDNGRSVPVAVYVADDPTLRARGLMGRRELRDGTGMLFTYEADTTGSFWMRNTLIPLSIAFFRADGEAIASFDMEPCTTVVCPRYGPASPFRYALEVPRGWFDDNGIGPGWRLEVDGVDTASVENAHRRGVRQ